uniref:Fibronectin type-III domain-containing protein n=1 Tax=Astyanax mexicanus TaxID=7994 RepID=A0A3B1JEN6_ASTMX
LRTDFVYFENIRVRVSAESPMGSVHSDFADFHTGSIREPIPPEFTSNTFNPLEIFWNVEREDDNVEKCHCEVRYKNEWTLFKAQCNNAEIRSFCSSCGHFSAPVGKLDVWSNCEADLDEPICAPYCLKNTVLISRHRNSSKSLCYFTDTRYQNSLLVDYKISLNSVLLPFVLLGLPIPEVNMTVKMKSQSLDVSWSAPQQFSESIQEYVVQYKLIGLPHQLCLDWTKVNKTTNSVRLKGKCVHACFNVLIYDFLNQIMLLFLPTVPPKVTDVKVTEIFPSKVKLTWKPIPLEKSNGFILEYLVGIDNHTGKKQGGGHNVMLDLCITESNMICPCVCVCVCVLQFRQSWLANPSEYTLTVSQVEVFIIPENPLDPEEEEEEEEELIASRDDEYEEWEEQACPSDYEKHFMPCIQDA